MRFAYRVQRAVSAGLPAMTRTEQRMQHITRHVMQRMMRRMMQRITEHIREHITQHIPGHIAERMGVSFSRNAGRDNGWQINISCACPYR